MTEMKAPKMQQIEYNQIVEKLITQGWLSKSYDMDSADTKYTMTEMGGIHYVIACLLLDIKSLFNGPVMNPLVKTTVDLSMNNKYVRNLITSGMIVKSVGTDGLSKTVLTYDGAKTFWVLTSIAGKAGIPTTLGVKIERGMFKAIGMMGRVAEGMNKLAVAMDSGGPPQMQQAPNQPVRKPKKTPIKPRKYTSKKAHAKQKTTTGFAYELSRFPNPHRSDWSDV